LGSQRVPDSLGGIVASPVHVLSSAHGLGPAHMTVALNLEANQEGR